MRIAVGLEAREVEQVLDELEEALRLLRQHAAQLVTLLRRQVGLTFVERPHRAVDRRGRSPELVRGERRELALQLVQPPQVALLDRPLEERGDERAERRQQLDLRLVEREDLAALIARQEAETPPVADQRHDDERADAEAAGDSLRHVDVCPGVLGRTQPDPSQARA